MKIRLLLAWSIPQICSLSLKPFSPNVYWPGEHVPVSVNKLTSASHDTIYNYYDLPFVCQPRHGISKTPISLDEVLRGDRVFLSDISVKMLENEPCHVLCTKTLNHRDIQEAYELIRKDYKVEWLVDGLPGATSFATHDRTHKYYASGFRLGTVGEDGYTYLNNHFTLVIKYRHSDNHDATRVVLAFEVYPRSVEMAANERRGIDRKYPGSCELKALERLDTTPAIALNNPDRSLQEQLNVTYTYSVYFREDLTIHWASRWDLYFYYRETTIVWYSTAISAIICILLTSVVGAILVRTLSVELKSASKPFKNELELVSDDSAGWKLLRNDIARPPERPDLLAALIAVGIQLTISLIALLVRSKLSSSLGLFLLLFASTFAGYYSGKTYKSFDMDDWQRQGLLTALGVPGAFFSGIVLLNFLLWVQGASQLPMSTLFELLCLWFGAAFPLVMIGVYTGAKNSSVDNGASMTKPVPRVIPRQPIFTRFWPSLIIAGALPYAAICVELYFILQAFQLHQTGYLSFIFGSLSLVLFIAVVTNLEITVTMVYLLLNQEDHRWHWRAFLYGAASAGYIYAHATFYFLTRLQYGFINAIVYFGCTTLFCLLFAMVQGMLGYTVSSIFVAKIYGSIKVD